MTQTTQAKDPLAQIAPTDEIRPLIFGGLSVRWAEITLKQPYPLKPSPGWKLRSFPLPGHLTPRDVTAITVGEEGLTFPTYGDYYIVGPFGAAKILLIDPSVSDDEAIIALGRFISDASWHSASDTHLGYDGDQRYPFYPGPLLRKLFYSDQPLGLWCGHVADLSAFLLHWMGHSCRVAHLKNDNSVGHIFLDVYLPIAKKWAMLDPDFGVMLRHQGAFISSSEVVELRAAGKTNDIELFDLTQAPLGEPGVNFPPSFSGQFTWKPEYSSRTRSRLPGYYHEVVIEKGFVDTVYSGYRIDKKVVSREEPIVLRSGWVSRADLSKLPPPSGQ